MIQRMIGAARLDTKVYEEVEADTSATRQALAVVVLVALATGIGAIGSGGAVGFVVGIAAAIGLWALWAWITYFVGTTILKTAATKADWGQLANSRVCSIPRSFQGDWHIPVLGPIVFGIASIWQLVAWS